MYIYIYIEREMYTYIYIYIHIPSRRPPRGQLVRLHQLWGAARRQPAAKNLSPPPDSLRGSSAKIGAIR